jgi:hypothetical protein
MYHNRFAVARLVRLHRGTRKRAWAKRFDRKASENVLQCCRILAIILGRARGERVSLDPTRNIERQATDRTCRNCASAGHDDYRMPMRPRTQLLRCRIMAMDNSGNICVAIVEPSRLEWRLSKPVLSLPVSVYAPNHAIQAAYRSAAGRFEKRVACTEGGSNEHRHYR